MVFTSSVFLYAFLPLFLGIYYLTPRRWKALTIALGSYLFYGWWRPDFVLLMFFSTVVDFICGERITRARAQGRRGKAWVVLSVLTNLGLLGYFKYANFGIDTFNSLFPGEAISWTSIVLPVGISFYTFQTMSYTIDVYRGTAEKVDRFRDFMCYVALFPQLVAGPIVRYNSIAKQLKSREHTFAKFYQGVLCFQIGLVKKVLIADNVGQIADQAFIGDKLPVIDAWIGLLAYTFQIYFDFSGYSDMAIGLGLMIGFRFPINFNQPYRSVGITEFWRRWHISLSTWLRDYLYIPLGGNRKGSVRTYVNLALIMILGGLWHGAALGFIAWGAYHGLLLIIERFAGKHSLYSWMPRPIQVAVTFVLVMAGWVFFRAESLPLAMHYFSMLAGAGVGSPDASLLNIRVIQVGAMLAGAFVVWFVPTTQRLTYRSTPLLALGVQVVFLVAILHLHFTDYVPFLYFQF